MEQTKITCLSPNIILTDYTMSIGFHKTTTVQSPEAIMNLFLTFSLRKTWKDMIVRNLKYIGISTFTIGYTHTQTYTITHI